MLISNFYNNEYADYASYDNFRSLGNVTDGLKPSARKVLYTARKQNVKSNLKVSIFASDISKMCEYLHGAVSLEGVIVGMAQDFAGSNNINLLLPEGSFGTRQIPVASASRYIFTKKSNIIDYLFKSDDDNILIQQEFEGSIIEPKHFIPIIPMILVNGSEGIGNGFAQKILPRNPNEIIKQLILRCTKPDAQYTNLVPYYKDFKGTILWDSSNDKMSWVIKGLFERTNTTTIMVTELPISYDGSKYLSILNKLVDDKVITDYIDHSNENTFKYEIKAPREFVKKDDEYIYDKLKLYKRVTENFTCLGEDNSIKEFSNDGELFDYYIKIRLEYYTKRKEYLIEKLKSDLRISGSKFFFVKLVLEDKIKVFKQTKQSILDQIEKNDSFPFHKVNNTFLYITSMPISSFSSDTITELKEDIQQKKILLKEITEVTIQDMWVNELNDLKLELSKLPTK